jgi:hypothetical protein
LFEDSPELLDALFFGNLRQDIAFCGVEFSAYETLGDIQGSRLLPLMEKSLHITIHAGENVDVPSIWEAVYHLNAERIGHGLTLRENPELMKHVIDKKHCRRDVSFRQFSDHRIPGQLSARNRMLREAERQVIALVQEGLPS